MRLIHLSAVGAQVPPATLEFASRLTVIYGASEAGKSYISEAIDFVLGASRLRYVPESEGYQYMLLALELDGEVLTLARNFSGGNTSIYEGDLRNVPDYPPLLNLRPSHSKGREDTVSHFLLEYLGLAGSVLRKNKRNETIALSFRHIAHLIIIGEERMHLRTSPVETGNYATRTSERSALKLLLEGEDDSGFDTGEDPTTFRKLNKAQLEVLDKAIAQVGNQLEGIDGRTECVEMLEQVNGSIQSYSKVMSTALAEREKALTELDESLKERNQQRQRAGEANLLYERFSLLDEQYRADLQRLEMVRSAGTLLGYFDAESCVFCGANVEKQHRKHAIYETSQLTETIDTETSRTKALQKDLSATLDGIRSVLEDSVTNLTEVTEKISRVTVKITELESQLGPVQDELDLLMERRSDLERWITLWDQIEKLRTFSSSIAQESPETVRVVSPGISNRALDSFSAKLRRVFSAWKVPEAESAEFIVEKEPEIVLNGRPRADYGKGLRSILHAGFSTALSEYCLENELPFPGFLVLDTPVLTYRDADSALEDSVRASSLSENGEERVAQTVAQSFYDYLSESPVQSVVLENQTPPNVVAEGCKIEYFSGTDSHGRKGFYPT